MIQASDLNGHISVVELKIHSAGRKPDPDHAGGLYIQTGLGTPRITPAEAIGYGQEGKPTAIMSQTQRSRENLVDGSLTD